MRKVNPSVYQRRESGSAKRRLLPKRAQYLGINILRPSVFPLNSVKALRGAFVAIEQGKASAYSRACFEAYWCNDKDISREDELRKVVVSADMDPESFFQRIAEEPVKKQLFDTTDDLIRRGGFGSPTFFLNRDDMYFGNDRLELMQAALDRAG